MKTEFYIGVDPGLSGAIAVLDDKGDLVYLRDMPKRKDVSKNTVDISELRQDEELLKIMLRPSELAIERVSAMPARGTANGIQAQGIASTFTFGKAAGKIEGFFEANAFEPTLVMPTVWKRVFDLLKKEKRASVFKARELWPDFEKQFIVSKDGRADAALIAKWLWEKHHG